MDALFVSFVDALLKLRLDFSRLNSIRVAMKETYKIVVYTATNKAGVDYTVRALRDSKGKDYSGSLYQFAALRLLPDGGTLTSEWFHDFKYDLATTVLQHVYKNEVMPTGKNVTDMLFEAVAELRVWNEQVPEVNGTKTPVYEDVHYTGFKAFDKAYRALIKDKDSSFIGSKEYNTAMFDMRAVLHATELIAGRAKPENEVRLPVFKYTY